MKEIILTLGINFDVSELSSIASEIPFSNLGPVSRDSSSFDESQASEIVEFSPSFSLCNNNEPDSFVKSNPDLFLFKCQFCDKGFTVSVALSKHIQKHFAASEISEQNGISVEKDLDQANSQDPSETMFMKSFPNLSALQGQAPTHFPEKEVPEIPMSDSPDMETNHFGTRKQEINQQDSTVSVDSVGQKGLQNLVKSDGKIIREKSRGLECPICSQGGFQSQAHLCRHIGNSHYSEQLEKKFGPFESSCCLCNKPFDSKRSWLGHLLLIHKALPIPAMTEMTVQKSNSEESKNPPMVPITSTISNPDLLIQNTDSNKNKCFICQKLCSHRQSMFRHLGNIHYSRQLTEKYGPFKSSCKLCKRKMVTEGNWRQHLIAVHKVFPASVENDETLADKNAQNEKSKMQRNTKVSITTASKENMKRIQINKEDNTKENSSPKTKTIYYCPKCPRSDRRYQNLIIHISLIHYSDVLKSQMKVNNTCSICDHSFLGKPNLFYHLANSHKALKDHIPDRASLAENTFKI